MKPWAHFENIATLAAIVATILGVWAMGGGPWGFLALLLMLNLNSPKA